MIGIVYLKEKHDNKMFSEKFKKVKKSNIINRVDRNIEDRNVHKAKNG